MGDVLARLDVLANFAEVAVTAPKPYVRPMLCDEGAGVMILKQVRHPCLEVQDGTFFIANDVYFRQGKQMFTGKSELGSQLLKGYPDVFIVVTAKAQLPMPRSCGLCVVFPNQDIVNICYFLRALLPSKSLQRV
jgi:hypothetical protein